MQSEQALEYFHHSYTMIPESGCWLWLGGCTNWGYGYLYIASKQVAAHRFSYKYYTGEIPVHLVIDHLCRVRCCVNPTHLRLVTTAENILCSISPPARNKQQISCKYGHHFDETNTYRRKGHRICRQCRNRMARERTQRRRREKC